MSHDTNTGLAHIIFAYGGTVVTGVIIGAIDLYFGFGSGLFDGYLYYRQE